MGSISYWKNTRKRVGNMKNNNSSEGIAEDLIRAFTQLVCVEAHYKTLIEKKISEIENGFVEDKDIQHVLDEIDDLKNQLSDVAQLRREEMLHLYQMFGEKGDKSYWCSVKHLASSAYTIFECYQASDDDADLLTLSLETNKQLMVAVGKFLGVTITSCASCFSDILKSEVKGDNNGEQSETKNLQNK